MEPKFLINQTKFPDFNPFELYDHVHDDHQHFPPLEIDNLTPELPSLQDVNLNQFDTPQFSVHLQELKNHDPINYSSLSKSKSKSTFPPPGTLELISNYQSKIKRVRDDSINDTIVVSDENLSTVEIIELAAEKFIKFFTQRVDGYTMFTHPYGSSAFTSLSVDETREVQLVFQLLTAAEKVGRKQFEIATRYLLQCGQVASDEGTPVERLVYYLSEALHKRMGNETGIYVSTRREKLGLKNENPMAMGSNPTFLACHQGLPFNQVLQFTGVQAILDQVGTSKKIHLIDIHIRSGVQWTAMIQAASERKSQIEILKLTAFATSSDVQKVSETGKRLESFAASLSLPFVFKSLVLSDISEVEEQQFEVQEGETVAIYCHLILRTLISRTQGLEKLMRAIRMINPSIIVMAEVEANHNSTSFVNRFTETLFFYGALFDCLEACMSRNNAHRAILEGAHLADGMQNIVANEGDERISRSVGMNTWRSFFVRFGMEEIELSNSCMYQANLVLKQFSCASSCTIENNGKCLIVGWKGTPLHSLSTWRFVH
ncbi:DELLA protein RGL1-like [Rutidosis leptorrhynchoides]|uniref:DELLA protein RGL1-like n=1 Tax=Rutidosis leptorrhynchoides TaxID=125765 RepID=UPI003A9965B5